MLRGNVHSSEELLLELSPAMAQSARFTTNNVEQDLQLHRIEAQTNVLKV